MINSTPLDRARQTAQQGLAKRLTDKTVKLRKEQEEHKHTKAELKTAQDMIAALTQENLELGKINKDLVARFEKGGLAVAVNNGFVVEVGVIPKYSEYTYDQPIPSGISTALYKHIPFIELHDRQLRINETQYKKYKGALL